MRGQISSIHWIIEKPGEFQEKKKKNKQTTTSALLTKSKNLTVWITVNCGMFLDVNTRSPYPPLEKSVCRSGRNS